jgi:hypothetical protein
MRVQERINMLESKIMNLQYLLDNYETTLDSISPTLFDHIEGMIEKYGYELDKLYLHEQNN